MIQYKTVGREKKNYHEKQRYSEIIPWEPILIQDDHTMSLGVNVNTQYL